MDESYEKEFETSVGDLRGVQILHSAFAAGAAIFLVVVVGLYIAGSGDEAALSPEATESEDNSLLTLMSLVHAFMFVSTWSAGMALYKTALWKKRPASSSASPSEAVGEFWMTYRGAFVVRAGSRIDHVGQVA